jgi:hypothetical protein
LDILPGAGAHLGHTAFGIRLRQTGICRDQTVQIGPVLRR